MYKLLLASMLAVISANVYSAEYPQSMGFDQRVTSVKYQEGNVVELMLTPGVATNIVLEKGEEYKAHAFGDSEAWHFTYFENNLFIKPAKPLGTTNLTVITNKRNYVFETVFNKDFNKNHLFQVRFEYPNVLNEKQLKEIEEQKIKEKFEDAKTKKIYNLNYTMRGSKAIAPVNVYDDGTFTYFKFPGNVDLPAIYTVTYDDNSSRSGEESMVNKTVEGVGNDTIVMHKVHYSWRLRLGDSVLDIRNDNMNWKGELNKSGTIAPDVQRITSTDDVFSKTPTVDNFKLSNRRLQYISKYRDRSNSKPTIGEIQSNEVNNEMRKDIIMQSEGE